VAYTSHVRTARHGQAESVTQSAALGVFGKSDPGLECFLQVPGYVVRLLHVPGFRVCVYNRKAGYAHTPGSDSCWLRASSCQLAARVKQARNRVTAAAAIPAGVCNSPARPRVAPSSCTTRRRPSSSTSVWRTLALGELFTVRRACVAAHPSRLRTESTVHSCSEHTLRMAAY
jgi:hypothetical protein